MGLFYFPIEEIIETNIVMANIVEPALPSSLVEHEKRGLSQRIKIRKLGLIYFHTS